MGRQRLILRVVESDRTFRERSVRGERMWVGKCIHCNAELVVGLDGRTFGATLEHILPRHHGGTDDIENLALACERCNVQKGYRLDARRSDDPRLTAVVEALLARRRERMR